MGNRVMAVIQWTLAIVGVLALGIVAAGYFLPSSFDVRRSAIISAPPDKVYDLIADPRNWKQWSAWHQRDKDMDVVYAGPLFGQGARWSWKSKSEGNGSMTFTRVEPDRRIEYSLTLPDFGLKSAGIFAIEKTPAGTNVIWSNSGDVGTHPLKHYFAFFMDRLVGPDFEQGLANLKALAEKP
jgi:uncharacterized protein YndB with AHSA1/START domain